MKSNQNLFKIKKLIKITKIYFNIDFGDWG